MQVMQGARDGLRRVGRDVFMIEWTYEDGQEVKNFQIEMAGMECPMRQKKE